MAKGIQLEQFIERAKQRERDKLKLMTLDIEGFGTLQLKSIGFDALMDLMDGLENASTKEQANADKELVYKSIPMLSSKELQDSFDDLVEPYDIVYKVFDVKEVNLIVQHLMILNGFGMGVDDLKNS